MEYDTGIHDAFHSLQDGSVATDIVGAWRQATPPDGLSREREADTRGYFHSVGFMSGSGMPLPGISRGIIASAENAEQHQEDDRETSFNTASEAE